MTNYRKIAELELELEALQRINTNGKNYEDAVATRARILEIHDIIISERTRLS